MKKDIIIQSFNYAEIDLYKNYSNIERKKGLFPWDFRLYKKNQRSFFHTLTPTYGYYRKHSFVEFEIIQLNKWNSSFFQTDKDRQIKKYYNNPFATITVNRIERSIKQDNDKVTVKIYKSIKIRSVGNKFFRKQSYSTTITFDLLTGNFRIILYNSLSKEKRKCFYTNSFPSLKEAIFQIFKPESYINGLYDKSKLYQKFIDTFSDNTFRSIINTTLKLDLYIDSSVYAMNSISDFIHSWASKFIELKKIKSSNNGEYFIKNYYPTEKYLKKNNRKLVASMLDKMGILSKITLKLLHKYPYMDLIELCNLCVLFGNGYTKYIGNIDEGYFVKISKTIADPLNQLNFREIENIDFREIENNEKENLVKIINNQVSRNMVGYGVTQVLYDHFRIMNRLFPYYPELRLNSRKWETFTVEHSEMSALERNLQPKNSIHYVFDDNVIDTIQKPIEILTSFDKITYNPILLKTSDDFIEEGKYMNHCVAGYVTNYQSIIVSLRFGSERVTCQYDIKNKQRIQSKFFNNEEPPEHFKNVIEKMDQRIKNIHQSLSPIETKLKNKD